jgi:hypothetical protein
MSIGNFLERAETQNGISVGFGKMILIYSTEHDVLLSDLTAAAINEDIADGTIKGIIQGWNTVAGASVAEKNSEKLDGSIKLVKHEILADVLTFEDNVTNNRILKSLVKGGTYPCLLLDDMGYAFGSRTLEPVAIGTMNINFSNKTSNGLQNDLTNEKTVAVTARYLVEEIGYIDADVEVEDIVAKIPLIGKISSITTHIAASIVFVMDVYNEITGELLTSFDVDPVVIVASVNGISVTPSASFAANQLTVTLAKTVADFNTATDKVKMTVSTGEYYLTEITFNIADFIVPIP